MKKLILPVLILAGVFACEKMNNSMRCGEYDISLKFRDDADEIWVNINNETIILNLVQSASGAKYDGVMKNGNVLTLWAKGDDWTMFINDGQPVYCK